MDKSGFYIWKSKDGQFYFYLRAANGEKLVTSEMYTTKQSAKDGIAAVIKSVDGGTMDMTT